MVGYFGWGNFGDELFVKTHRQQLGEDYELFVANDLLQEPYFSTSVSEIVESADAALIGGGDLINPMRVSGLYWNMDWLNKPVFIFGIGVPNQPFERKNVIDHYRRFMQHPNCKLIVARDPESYAWLKKNLDLGDKLVWYPDPVCALELPDAIPAAKKTLGIVMREHRSLNPDMSNVRALIDEAKKYGYSIKHLVLATDELKDGDLKRAELIAEPDEEIVSSDNLDELCQEISSCSALATIKFHGMVVATMYGIPSIAMSVTPKNKNFLRLIERTEMLASYTSVDLQNRLSIHPAPIHHRVSDWLRSQSTLGYSHLKIALNKELG